MRTNLKMMGCVGSLVLMGFSSGCGSSTATEDTSTSGTVASVIGGAVGGTSSNGTQSFNEASMPSSKWAAFTNSFSLWHDAVASSACPTFLTTGTGCSAATSSMTLTYSSCSFGSSAATWSGSQVLTLSTGTPACGTFPAAGSYTGTLTRTFGSSTSRTAASGTVVSLDTSGLTAGFDGTTHSGGVTATFSSGSRTGFTINGINLISQQLFSHTLYGSLSFNEGTRTISTGSVTVLHNLAKVVGTSTLTNVVFSATCCTPTSGTIQTTFTQSGAITPLISSLLNKTETLSFTGCGTATYTDVSGSTKSVTLNHCL